MNTNTERYELNKQLAQMLKGGVIMDVTTPEQARIAEEAGACAVMALERIPAEPAYIITKWGVGYYFAGEDQPTI